MTDTQLKAELPTMAICDIALLILADWKNIYFGAKPHLKGMLAVRTLTDRYYFEDGETQVRYFLGNAGTWRGERAKLIKAELKRRLK